MASYWQEQLSGFNELDFQARVDLIAKLVFLSPQSFQAAWLGLMWQLNTRPLKQSKKRQAELRSALWQMTWQKLKSWPDGAEQKAIVPLELALYQLAQDYQSYQDWAYWEILLRTWYPQSQLLDRFSVLLSHLPGIKPATRKALFGFGIRFLAPNLPDEQHLDALGDMVQAAQKLKYQTQAELLLDEMVLLLEQQPSTEQLQLSADLILQWMKAGYGRQARFALKLWRQQFQALNVEQQVEHLDKLLFSLSWRIPRHYKFKLDDFSLLQSWLNAIWNVVPENVDYPYADLKSKLCLLAHQWHLPEAQTWLNQQIHDAFQHDLVDDTEFVQQAAWHYLKALHALHTWEPEKAQTLAIQIAQSLPYFMHRWNPDLSWTLEAIRLNETYDRSLIRQLFHLQTAALLVQIPAIQKSASRRQKLIDWGFDCVQTWTQSELADLQTQILSALKQAPSFVRQANLESAQNLYGQMLSLEHWAHQRQRAYEVFENELNSLELWLNTVLALKPEWLSEQHLCVIQDLVKACPDPNKGWKLNLILAASLGPHLPWEAIKPYWLLLFELWPQLDEYEQLSSIASIGLALAKVKPPETNFLFAHLLLCAQQVSNDFRADAIKAVGHCQIRAGLIAEGLETLALIKNASERLHALWQIGSVLNEVKDRNLYPEVMQMMLQTAQAQSKPEFVWKAYGAVSLAYCLKQDFKQALGHYLDGLNFV